MASEPAGDLGATQNVRRHGLDMKIPALKALAPKQSEPPFIVTQVVVILIFICPWGSCGQAFHRGSRPHSLSAFISLEGLLYPPCQAEHQLSRKLGISIPGKGLTVGGDHEHTFEI
jgi:hypothetical protein